MCGFLGEINFKYDLADKNKFVTFAKQIEHRGPDNFGYITDNKKIQLGFNRLSILDISSNGNQPMQSICGRYYLVFNGEIYNHKQIFELLCDKFMWKGKSDTEVLLNAWAYWGEQSLKKIDGMFAFAIWDKELNKIIMARDRVGEKPLYYYHNSGHIIFSSRPRPITRLIKNFKGFYDNSALSFYLQAGYFPRNQSCFEGIKKLEPGSYIEISENNFKLKKYWNINCYYQENSSHKTFDYDNLDFLIKSSVREKLISDKPLGFFLSGGIDSSLICSVAEQIIDKENIHAFNLGFDNPNYDESRDAEFVAKNLGINLYQKKLNSKELLKLIPKLYNKFDEPFSDPACFPLMAISEFAKQYVDVVISGDGGDELFGGYEYYRIIKILNFFGKSKNFIIIFLKILKILGNKAHKFELLKIAIQIKDPLELFAFLRSVQKDFISVLDDTCEIKNSLASEFLFYSKSLDSNADIINKIMKIDLMYNFNDNYLQKTDLSTMAHSLECRSPFLSRDILELSLNTPSCFKVGFLEKKIALKKIAQKYIPKKILEKKKQGFEMPIKEWLRNDLRSWAENIIFDKNSYKNLPIVQEKVIMIFNLHQSKKRDCHPYLWTILMLLEFNRTNNSY